MKVNLIIYILVIVFIVIMVYLAEIKPFEKVSIFDVDEDFNRISINLQLKNKCKEKDFIIKIFNKENILAKNDKFIAIKDNCGYLQLRDKKSKKLIKKFNFSDKEVLAAKFLNNFLYVYQKGIYKIDLASLKVVAEAKSGINGVYAKIFPMKDGIIVFVRKKINKYLIYYKYTNKNSLLWKNLEMCNIYKLKPFLYDIFMKNNDIYINLDNRFYKIYPKDEELGYEVVDSYLFKILGLFFK